MFRLIFLVIVFSYRQKEVDSCIPAGTWRNVIDHRYEKIYKSTNITDVVPALKSKEDFLNSKIKPKDSKYFRNEGKEDNDSKVSEAVETGQTTSKLEISGNAEEKSTTVATTTFKPNTLDDP